MHFDKAFQVFTGPASLFSLLKVIYQWVDERTQQKGPAQSFSTMNTHRNPSLNTRSTSSNNQEREEIPTRLEEVNLEDISIHFLCTYSTDPNWKQIVSSCNDYGQTLAHIAVTLGYFRLLHHLFRWQIDLNAVDSTGLSPLHYAYLFKQGECAKILIHSGVDRCILDDLGRSPADLDPSLKVRLGSSMDMDSDSSADGAPAIEYDLEMPDEAEKLYAKHFLTQQWMGESEGERRGEVPLSRWQSHETSSPPALDSMGVPCDGSSSLVSRTPEERSTPVVAEEIDSEALTETATPTHSIHPPSPISEVSPQAQESNSPSEHPVSPLGGAITTPGPEDAQTYRGTTDSARPELSAASLALCNDHIHLDAVFDSGHTDGLSVTNGTSMSIYGSTTTTETDTTLWFGQAGSGPYDGSGPSNFLQPPARWGEVSPLHPTYQPPTPWTLGKPKR